MDGEEYDEEMCGRSEKLEGLRRGLLGSVMDFKED